MPGKGLAPVGAGSQVFESPLSKPLKIEDSPILNLDRPNVDVVKVQLLIRELLFALGENPNREGLQQTPARVAKMWQEFLEHDAGKTDTVFEAVTFDQIVVVSPIDVWSFCEHHLLPFRSLVTVGYLADKNIIGLSKIARIVTRHSHKLQIQERLVHEIADDLGATVETKDVAVMARGEHCCMSMRGVQKDATMTTSVLRGIFRHSSDARREFLAITFGGRI
jgi:GTP cyclohydrolase IA